MIHASEYKPIVMPVYADLNRCEMDRVQDLSATSTLNRTKIEEVGRDGIVGWRSGTPSISLSIRQLEYGSLEFYRKLANVGDSVVTIPFTDFKTSAVDIAGYETDDNGTFLGTVYYPELRMSGLGFTIGDPEALIERNFSLVGEDKIMLREGNKYLIHKRAVIGSTGLNQTVTLSDPTPVADPDNSGQFLFKVVKISGGTATKLNHGTDWSYDGAGTLTINGSSTAGDVIKAWYSAASFISGENPFSLNDADLAAITADSVTIFLQVSNQVYRLQSVGIDTTFDRFDIREIGNTETVARGVRDITNSITLGRILENYTVEEILRGEAGNAYGKINIRNFSDDLSLTIKVYEDNTKSNFKLGYKFIDLSPVGMDDATPVNEYVNQGVTLEGETALVTSVEAVL